MPLNTSTGGYGDLGGAADLTVYLTNMDTQEEFEFAGNPDDLKISMAANYTEFDVVGSSFKPMQYAGTDNIQLTFTLKIIPETVAEFDNAHELENYIYALMLPAEPGLAPPDTLIVWPEYIVMYVKVLSAEVSWTHYNGIGKPVLGSIALTVKNTRAERLLAGEMRRTGLRQ